MVGRIYILEDKPRWRIKVCPAFDNTNIDNCAEVDALIKENIRTTVSEIALHVGISYGSAFAIVHIDLGYHKICAR
jgi:hypothetical protein